MLASIWKFSPFLGLVAASQTAFETTIMQEWSVELSKEWDVLGPFPIHAREQHFISPSFPLDLSTRYQHEPDREWFSSYADGGKVGWSSFNATQTGHLLVSFPHIRWNNLRATEGWAALQYHSVLRTTIKLIPPAAGSTQLPPPRLAFSLLRGSFFTLIPENPTTIDKNITPEWHPGNMYALPHAPKQLVEPQSLSPTKPTTYHLFVSGDYEIRLFGDPIVSGRQDPVLDVSLNITLEPRQPTIALQPTLDVTCDFVEGWAFGTALGIGIRAVDGRWEVLDVRLAATHITVPFSVSLFHKQRLAPSQTRVIPVKLQQTEAFRGNAVELTITLRNTAELTDFDITTSLKIRHRSRWNAERYEALKATYFLAGTPTLFLALPPLEPNFASPRPPILALHGAGVDISEPFWPDSLPRQRNSWTICPAGRTSWGFDWRGPSADDAWGSLASLTYLLASNLQWAKWEITEDTRVVVIGHSNGGQGTWFLTARHPDRVIAAIPAAGYIKSQQYIPLTLSRGAHFVDPSLRAILDASLTPDDNDLFLSNVVDMNILAIHGGEDDNVPTWHSREMVGLVKSWWHDANISIVEDPGKPHWYPDVLNSSRVRKFLASVLEDPSTSPTLAETFTLTVATPGDSGSLRGFAIQEFEIPGRLARLYVTEVAGSAIVRTANVHTFTINVSNGLQGLSVNGILMSVSQFQSSTVWVRRAGDSWTAFSEPPPPIRPVGPLSQILRSPSRLLVVVPTGDLHSHSIATRLAHAMLLYFRLDVEIITDAEALIMSDPDLSVGDIVVVGSNNAFGDKILRHGPGLIEPSQNGFTIHGRRFAEASLGLLFLHPHPSAPSRVVLFLCGVDSSGLERAARLLLPIRTGVTLPEFIIIGSNADSYGVGGLHGAGFWNRTWGWSENMAWLD